jgi:hypothetical protein
MPYQDVMHKFKHGQLHSGSKKGPKVKSRQQAIAIMMSEKRKGTHSRPSGSGPFSDAEMDKGYKVMCSSTQLHEMDPDRLHNMKDWVMAERRNGTHMEDGKRKNLRRLED